MSQEPTADQGDINEAITETPVASDDESNGVESYGSILERGLREARETIGKGLDPQSEGESEVQPPTEGDDSAGESAGQGGLEPPPAAAAESPEEAMARWITKVANNPKSINEIPAKHHPAIVERAIQAERALQEQAAQMAYRQGMEDGTAQYQRDARIAAAVAEVNEAREADPAAYVQWREDFPDRAQAYDEARKSPKSTPGNANGPSAVAELSAAFEPLIAKLAEYPDAYARIQAKASADRQLYLQTPAGFAQLSIDVAEEIATDRMKSKPVDPDQKAIEARQRAAAERKNIPRPDGTEGVGGQGAPLSNDPRELLAQGWRESRAAALARR